MNTSNKFLIIVMANFTYLSLGGRLIFRPFSYRPYLTRVICNVLIVSSKCTFMFCYCHKILEILQNNKITKIAIHKFLFDGMLGYLLALRILEIRKKFGSWKENELVGFLVFSH